MTENLTHSTVMTDTEGGLNNCRTDGRCSSHPAKSIHRTSGTGLDLIMWISSGQCVNDTLKTAKESIWYDSELFSIRYDSLRCKVIRLNEFPLCPSGQGIILNINTERGRFSIILHIPLHHPAPPLPLHAESPVRSNRARDSFLSG